MVWPVNYLRINTPRLQLRLATAAEAGQLASDSVGRLLLPERAHWLEEWASEILRLIEIDHGQSGDPTPARVAGLFSRFEGEACISGALASAGGA